MTKGEAALNSAAGVKAAAPLPLYAQAHYIKEWVKSQDIAYPPKKKKKR
jgi:hypothetical protein